MATERRASLYYNRLIDFGTADSIDVDVQEEAQLGLPHNSHIQAVIHGNTSALQDWLDENVRVLNMPNTDAADVADEEDVVTATENKMFKICLRKDPAVRAESFTRLVEDVMQAGTKAAEDKDELLKAYRQALAYGILGNKYIKGQAKPDNQVEVSDFPAYDAGHTAFMLQHSSATTSNPSDQRLIRSNGKFRDYLGAKSTGSDVTEDTLYDRMGDILTVAYSGKDLNNLRQATPEHSDQIGQYDGTTAKDDQYHAQMESWVIQYVRMLIAEQKFGVIAGLETPDANHADYTYGLPADRDDKGNRGVTHNQNVEWLYAGLETGHQASDFSRVVIDQAHPALRLPHAVHYLKLRMRTLESGDPANPANVRAHLGTYHRSEQFASANSVSLAAGTDGLVIFDWYQYPTISDNSFGPGSDQNYFLTGRGAQEGTEPPFLRAVPADPFLKRTKLDAVTGDLTSDPDLEQATLISTSEDRKTGFANALIVRITLDWVTE